MRNRLEEEQRILGIIFGGEKDAGGMMAARQAAYDETTGFQGCRNQAICGFDGFYNCKYSPEGLCYDCEAEYFPERFYGCLFCRYPLKYRICCCRSDFDKWVKKCFFVLRDDIHGHPITDHAISLICSGSDVRHIVSSFPVIPRKEVEHLDWYRPKMSTDRWPGFYAGKDADGNHIWKIPTPPETPIRIIASWRECGNVLKEHLKKEFGIDIHQEIQIDM